MLKIQVQIGKACGKASYEGIKSAKISTLQDILFKLALFINHAWKYRNYLLAVARDDESYKMIRILLSS